MKKHNKVVRPKGLKQHRKGPGKKIKNPQKELGTRNKVLGGAQGKFMHKGKKVYGK